MAILFRALFVFFTLVSSAFAQQSGDFVTAHGYGYAWTLDGAKDEAYWDLMDDKEAIEDALPPHLAINWGTIRGQELDQMFGYGWHYTQVGTVYNPAGAACDAELDALIDILKEAEEILNEYLCTGQGWTGNMTGGPKCDVVHDCLMDIIRDLVAQSGLTLTCYDIATLFDDGFLPFDLASHIYIGIIDRRTKEVIYVIDPWRTGTCDPIPADEDPNGGDVEMVSPSHL